jgi:hypothetical protein
MITSLEVLVRSGSDIGIWADELEWWCSRPSGRWYGLAEAVPDSNLDIDGLARLWNQWEREGWLETKRDAGRIFYRPTDGLPIVTDSDMSPKQAVGQLVSAFRALRRRA